MDRDIRLLENRIMIHIKMQNIKAISLSLANTFETVLCETILYFVL